ncbi:MAG: hypothetical protein K2K74_04210, partial [Lachnospiraceae bacterium]|nr:hypothetical protein [Lachnospiraceae bacterium]
MHNKFLYILNCLLYALIIFIASNFFFVKKITSLYWVFLLLYAAVNFFPTWILPRTKRLKTCARGNALLLEFLCSAVLSVILFFLSFTRLPAVENIFQNPTFWIVNTLTAVLLEAIVFWNGMLRIFFSSKQLGIRTRILAVLCGMIPVAHLFVLGKMIRLVSDEIT